MLYGDLPDIKLEDDSVVPGVVFRVANPPKRAVLRLPTSDEILARLKQQKHVKRSLGRGKSKFDTPPNRTADLDLFNKIRLDKGPDFDEYEAENAISRLIYCETVDCEDADSEYRVTIATAFGQVIHRLGKPSVKDIAIFRRACSSTVDLPNNQEEIRTHIEPGAALYDSIVKGIEGYADSAPGNVPPHHKSNAVLAVDRALRELDVMLDPNS